MTVTEANTTLRLPPGANPREQEQALEKEIARVRSQHQRAMSAALRARAENRLEELQRAADALGIGVPDQPLDDADPRLDAPVVQPASASAEAEPVDRRQPRPSRIYGKPVLMATGTLTLLAIGYWFVQRPATYTESTTGLRFVFVADAGLWLGQHEVTLDAFKRFVDATGYRTDVEQAQECVIYRHDGESLRVASWRSAFARASADLPVTCVSWNDAQSFARWLSQVDGRSSYRLPTQAEWVQAAGGGTTAFSFGSDPSRISRHANLAGRETQFAWANEVSSTDRYESIAPVKSFRADSRGLYDLHGNVWEWVHDAHPQPNYRVIRGGGWATHPVNASVTSVNGLPASSGANDTGFRLLRIPTP